MAGSFELTAIPASDSIRSTFAATSREGAIQVPNEAAKLCCDGLCYWYLWLWGHFRLPAKQVDVIEIDTYPRLFVGDYVIDQMSQVEKSFHPGQEHLIGRSLAGR